MGASDGELEVGRSASAATRLPRPRSAPQLGQHLELNLEELTAEVVAAFQAGRREEALAGAVAFSSLAKDELGETHPTYINALATVAALLDQMGGKEQAAALLEEAEDLQEEVEMEALEREIGEQLEALQGGEEAPPAGSRPEPCGSTRDDGFFLTDLAGGADDSGDEAPGGDGGSDAEEGDLSDAGRAGGLELDPELDSEDEAAALQGLEALALTKLTFDVNQLLKDGRPEEAAKALGESERLLVEAAGPTGVSGMTRAAMHALWASILDRVGESEKARELYAEALTCLEDEVGLGVGEGSSSTSASEEEPDAPSDAVADAGIEAGVQDGPERKATPGEAAASQPAIAEEDEEEAGDSAAPPDPPQSGLPGPGSQPVTPVAPGPKGGPGRRPLPPNAVDVGAARPRPASTRTGGGFATVAPPKAPRKPRAPAKRGRAAPKATGSQVQVTDAEDVEISVEDDAEEPAPVVEPASVEPVAAPVSEPALSIGTVAEEPKAAPEQPLEQLAAVARAVTAADHLLGMLEFERAADKLEEQLVILGNDSCPHKGSDVHLDVLMKYGGVLAWDEDYEGAVDAFAAADELLAERPADDRRAGRRRAEVWMQIAQTMRTIGDLEGAEKQLTKAVGSLEDLVVAVRLPPDGAAVASMDEKAREDVREALALVEALREAQSALAQVCVQSGNFTRAEELYVAAFKLGEGEDTLHQAQDLP